MMRKAMAVVMLGAACVLLAGCFFDRRTEQPRMSIKDSPAASPISTGSLPEPKKELNVEERARAEQLKVCQQRHVDYQAGKLNETAEQKRIRDDICAELHRTDHARK